MIVGNVYLERGRPVEVLAQWAYPKEVDVRENIRGDVSITFLTGLGYVHPKRGGPRNVLIRRASGELVVRPFRGLRRP